VQLFRMGAHSINPILSSYETAVKRDFCHHIQLTRLPFRQNVLLGLKRRCWTVYSKNSHPLPAWYQVSSKWPSRTMVPNQEHQPKVLGIQIHTWPAQLHPVSLIRLLLVHCWQHGVWLNDSLEHHSFVFASRIVQNEGTMSYLKFVSLLLNILS
jgi:hypothetical protein